MQNSDLDDLPALYCSDAIRRIERAALQRLSADGVRCNEDMLMARAGLAAWRLLLARWPQAQRIGIVCGPGNNGGDGYVLAELARSSGRQVQVLMIGGEVREGPARRAAASYVQGGGRVAVFNEQQALPEVDVWVDALFGIGLHRALADSAADLVVALNAQSTPVLALDIPSGVDADSGDIPSAIGHAYDTHNPLAVQATVTLSFIAGKPGLFTGLGRAAAGEVVIDTLDIEADVFAVIEPAARRVRSNRLSRWLKPRPHNAHKGDFGHVLCVGGEHGFGGAIMLCAEAAARCGAGLVSVATRAEHVSVLLARCPEVMARAVVDLGDLDALIERANVIAIGPGLGRSDWSQTMLHAAYACGLPLVIDADALNLLALQPRILKDAVITPHPGEAARLLGISVRDVERDRVASAQRLAERFDAVVVRKGAGTVIAAPDHIPVIIDAGNPGMASGGMGDVLTGAIAALRAQQLSAFDAAVCGALLHATAGDAAARAGGERGLLASDLFAYLRHSANPSAHS